MEVKIKTKDFLVDATIEMVDGVMLVSPVADVDLKTKKWKPGVNEDFFYIGVRACFSIKENIFFPCEFIYETKEGLEGDKDIKEGNCFKTECEALQWCEKLNKAVNEVKEEMKL